MATVKGVVERKSKNQYGFGIMVDGKWYNSKYEIKCEQGDTVEFDDGDKNYCRKLRVVSSGGGSPASTGSGSGGYSKGQFPIGVRDGQRSIIRQNALTNAREFVTTMMTLEGATVADEAGAVDDIIDVARKFEAYTTGDMDLEEVKKRTKDFDPED